MPGTAKIASVVAAAARAGVIVDTPQSRAGAAASIRRYPEFGSDLLVMTADKATAARGTTTQPTEDYPSGWLPKDTSRVGGVRAGGRAPRAAGQRTTGSTSDYPASWRPVGATRRAGQSRVTEAGDS
jgi:hypothetical protein